jgi:hypothetical protein
MDKDQDMSIQGFSIMGAAILSLILGWAISRRTNCPLCITPVLATKHCSKHRRARPLLGSYRIRVALSILFKNSFRCPYCNEDTSLQVRERGRLSDSKG